MTTIRESIDFILEKKRIAETTFLRDEHEVKMYDSVLQNLVALGFYATAAENEKKKGQKLPTEDDIDADLNEIAHWFGGFDELKERVNLLHENQKEAAIERYYTKY